MLTLPENTCIGTRPSWLCRLAVIPTALDFAVRMTANPAPAGHQMPLRFSSKEPVPLLTKPSDGKSRKGARKVAPWTVGTCPRLSMRSLLSRISGALRPSIEAKPTFGLSWKRGTAQQASPRESGDKSHAVHRLRHSLLSFHPMGSVSLRPLGENQATHRYVQPLLQGVTQILVAFGGTPMFPLAARRTIHDSGVALPLKQATAAFVLSKTMSRLFPCAAGRIQATVTASSKLLTFATNRVRYFGPPPSYTQPQQLPLFLL